MKNIETTTARTFKYSNRGYKKKYEVVISYYEIAE